MYKGNLDQARTKGFPKAQIGSNERYIWWRVMELQGFSRLEQEAQMKGNLAESVLELEGFRRLKEAQMQGNLIKSGQE